MSVFHPGLPVSEETARALALLFVAIPVICNLLVAGLMWRFPLGRGEHATIRARLDQQRRA